MKMGDPEFVALASAARSKKALTANIRQRKFAREYVKSGNATQAAKIVYRMKQDSAEEYSRRLLKMPKIQVEVEKAMEKHGLDSDYALENIKKIVNAGTANLNATRPGDMLKALEMILKLKGLLGNRVVDENSESRIREKVAALGLPEIQKELAELDKNQKRLLDWTKEKVTEGEVVKTEEVVPVVEVASVPVSAKEENTTVEVPQELEREKEFVER
jgi:phage terminase small subunit